MSQTRTRAKTTRNFEFRSRGRPARGCGNTYHQKRNHSSGSNDNEKQNFVEGELGTQPNRGDNPSRKTIKRGRGNFYSKHKNSNYNSNGHLDSFEEPEFVKKDNPDQEACNYLETRCNNSSYKKAATSWNLSLLSGNDGQPVNDFSVQDKSSSSNNLSKPPIHSQNPIFVEELANRFHSILPPSTILSSEGPPQKILSNEDNLKSFNQTTDYYIPRKHQMQQCLQENNPHYPFMHCNMESRLTQTQESQAKREQYSKLEHTQKSIQSTSISENKSVSEITYSPTQAQVSRSKVNREKNSKPAFKQKSIQSTSSAENRSVKEINCRSKTNTRNHKHTNAYQAQPEPFLGNLVCSRNGGHDSFQNQNESNESMANILFSSIEQFTVNKNSINNNEGSTHQSEPEIADQGIGSQIRAFVSNSRANKQQTANQTKPNTEDIRGKCTSRTYNKHVMNESTSSCKTKVEQTQPCDVKIDKRNEILKLFGFPGNPKCQGNANKQAKEHLNPSSEITDSHQEEVLEANKINFCRNKGNHYVPDGTGRTLNSQRESFQTDNIGFQKKLELPTRNNNNIQNNRNISSNVSNQFSRNTNNSAPYELPHMASHPNSQNNQLPNQRNTFNKLQPEINKSDNEINMFNCTNQSTVRNSDLNNAKVAGGNVYNIHQPVNHLAQRVATRNEAVARLQDEYTGHLVEYKRKEQEKEAKKREEKLARYKYIDQGYKLTEGEGYFDEAVGGYDPDAGAFIEAEEEVRRRQQEQLNRDALIYQEYEQQKNEKLRKREEEKKKKELEKYKYVSHGYKLGGNEQSGPQVASPVLQNLSKEQARQRQQELLRRDALVYEEQERQKNEKLRKMAEEKKKNELEKYKLVSTGHILGGTENLDSVGGARRKTRSPQHDSAEVSKQASGDSVGGARRKTRSPQHDSTEVSKQESQLQKISGGPAREIKEKGTLDDSSQATSTTINSIEGTFFKFLQTNGILNQANSKEAEELRLTLLSQLQNVLANPNKTSISETQDSSLANSSENERNVISKASTTCTEKSTAIDSSVKPATYVIESAGKGPILVLRPSQEALENTISRHIAIQDLDKHGHSPLYAPQVEQAPIYSNNRFQQKPSTNTFKNNFEEHSHRRNRVEERNISDVVETHSIQKSLGEAAKSTGTIPKQDQSVDNSQAPHVDNSTTSLSKTETAEIDYQEELRAVRLRMQKRYDETIKNKVN